MKTLDYLLNISSKGIKYDLNRTHKLLKKTKNPEKKFLKIQIVGTNGKGSSAAFLSQVLQKNNYKVGLFTSPHLVDFKERIQINSKKISQHSLNQFFNLYNASIYKIKPSFFELLTVLALWYFKKNNIDIAILETGLGGRLDSVTACNNDFIIFTPISMDHHKILGSTLKKIAIEKSGAMIKKQQICFSTEQKKSVKKILIDKAKKLKLKIHFFEKNIKTKNTIIPKFLLGEHQIKNAQFIYQITHFLHKNKIIYLNFSKTQKAIEQTKWPGRFQIIKTHPTIIYDVAHNKESLSGVAKTIMKYKKEYENKILICGFENNKKIKQPISNLSKQFNKIICTETQIRKSMPAQKILKKSNKIETIINTQQAIQHAISISSNKDLIVILGSHFFAPTIKKMFKNCFAKNK